jgi:hypothetical protein
MNMNKELNFISSTYLDTLKKHLSDFPIIFSASDFFIVKSKLLLLKEEKVNLESETLMKELVEICQLELSPNKKLKKSKVFKLQIWLKFIFFISFFLLVLKLIKYLF